MGRTRLLPPEPDYSAPGGVAEIREMLSVAGGELTHATVVRGGVSETAWLDGLHEVFYVHAGKGAVWIDGDDSGDTVPLRPGRAVLIPPATPYQYRADDGEPLTLVLAVMPRWERGRHHLGEGGPWSPSYDSGAQPTRPATAPGQAVVKDLPLTPDYLAPDGSQIRLLPDVDPGGLSHCLVPPGQRTRPVRHRSVTEIWFVLGGMGELARWTEGAEADPDVTGLWYGVTVDIPTGTPFQFRSIGADPLQVLILTLPRWPGPDEAVTDVGHLDAWPA